MSHAESITQALAELEALPTKTLRQRWVLVFGGHQAPKLRRELLIAALGYQVQVDRLGGLKPRVLKCLETGTASIADSPVSRPRLPVGTRLMREWQQQTHVVDVTAEGFVWQGGAFRSLSAIARKITGTHWSGPRFFGLTAPSRNGQD